MIDDNYITNLNDTGDWLIKKAKKLISEIKKTKKVSKKLNHQWTELCGRMNLYRRECKKIDSDGEWWKTEN